jgi:hypothetical protein
MRLDTALLAAGTALLLAACGDSPQPEPAAPPDSVSEVPASAFVSATSYWEFTNTLTKTGTDTGKPLEVNSSVPPTSETEAPMPVN